MTNTTKVYVFTGLLFVFSYLLTSNLIKSFNKNDFNYVKIGVNVVAVIALVYLIIKYANLENNKKE
jgi:hypothetical protein